WCPVLDPLGEVVSHRCAVSVVLSREVVACEVGPGGGACVGAVCADCDFSEVVDFDSDEGCVYEACSCSSPAACRGGAETCREGRDVGSFVVREPLDAA